MVAGKFFIQKGTFKPVGKLAIVNRVRKAM